MKKNLKAKHRKQDPVSHQHDNLSQGEWGEKKKENKPRKEALYRYNHFRWLITLLTINPNFLFTGNESFDALYLTYPTLFSFFPPSISCLLHAGDYKFPFKRRIIFLLTKEDTGCFVTTKMKCLSMFSTYQLVGCAASWFSIVSFPNPILLYIKLPISFFCLFHSSGIKSHSTETVFFLFIALFLQLSLRLLSQKILTPLISGKLRMTEQVFKSGTVQPLWSAVLIATTARNYVITHLDTKTAPVNPSHNTADTNSGYFHQSPHQNQCFSEAFWKFSK